MSDVTRGETPLGLRRRRDLVAQQVRYRGRSYWNLHDPLTLRNYQLRPEEYLIFSLLDGDRSSAAICREFARAFAPRQIDRRQLNWFLASLHRESLVQSDAEGQGEQMMRRLRSATSSRRWGALTNPLAIRFRGINPTGLLQLLDPLARWVISPQALGLVFAWVLAAIVWAGVHFDQLITRLPRPEQALTLEFLIWLPVAVATVKILHELAHAFAARRFGAACRELGVMLLVFTPCLYCNVSDAWLIPNKWKRIAISAAGMLMELFIASIAFFLWWFSTPGSLNTLCLHLLFVCSVGTIFFNGNPCLRFDGYFILADWLEIPNLREQAAAVWRRRFAKWGFGVTLPTHPLEVGQDRLLVSVYGAASAVYRYCLLIAVIAGIYHLFRAADMEGIAVMLCGLVGAGVLINESSRLLRWLRDPAHRAQLRAPHGALATGAVLLALTTLAILPLPTRVTAPALLRPAAAEAVYVGHPGRVVWAAPEAATVAAGDTLAKLTNLELVAEIAALEAAVRNQELLIEQLYGRSVHDSQNPQAAAELPAASEALADYRRRLQQRRQAQDQLTLRAPRAGIVLASRRGREAGEALESWSGSPLEPRNRGCFLERGTRLCQVIEPDTLEATLLVPEHRVGRVQLGQAVELRFAAAPGACYQGEVVEVSPRPSSTAPDALAAAKRVAAKPADRIATEPEPFSESHWKPTAPVYQVRVALRNSDPRLRPQVIGKGRITVAPQSLAERFRAFLVRTF